MQKAAHAFAFIADQPDKDAVMEIPGGRMIALDAQALPFKGEDAVDGARNRGEESVRADRMACRRSRDRSAML
jgi:hypothetical protein